MAAAGVLAAVFTTASVHSMLLGLRLGVAAGAVNALVGTFSSSIEWWIENLPERRLGVIGLGLIITGMIVKRYNTGLSYGTYRYTNSKYQPFNQSQYGFDQEKFSGE